VGSDGIEPVGITNYISSSKIVLKHNIHVGMSLQKLLTIFNYLPIYSYQSFKVVQLKHDGDSSAHFYIFEDEILVKIIFYSPDILFKEEFHCE
jgi:hypothetical protein